jgi:outer membrane protein assembly factor BamA
MMRVCLPLILLVAACACAQGTAYAQDSFALRYHIQDKDTTGRIDMAGLTRAFASGDECRQYLATLPSSLQKKGYLAASVDSIRMDSLWGEAWVFIGEQYRWKSIAVRAKDEKLLEQSGWDLRALAGKPADFTLVDRASERFVAYMENHGYPFARIWLDSMQLDGQTVQAVVAMDKGPLYKIDSITVSGNARIKSRFLQRYLDIPAGSPYRKDKLDAISNRLLELPYAREQSPWNMTMLGTGSTLNLYLEQKKASQVNVLVGFLPDNTQINGKLLLTGEANINLRNAFGGGESIDVNWQQIQVQSPRLNLGYQQPYIFNSALGVDMNFDLFKKDSSFINLNFQLGVQYLVSARQTGRIFFQQFTTNLLTVDTNQVKTSQRLPPYLDVSASNLGLDYRLYRTDYRFNPRKGQELSVLFSAGIRRIRRNSAITDLTTDPSGNEFNYASLYDTLQEKTYLLRLKASGAQYIRVSKQSTLKAGLQAGWLQARDLFRNEMFQVGGYKLLRGFDEESIFATRYAVLTAEYRFLIGTNSFLFAFTDAGWAANTGFAEQESHGYLGFGGGITFETKAGILNLAYAVGKRDDLPLDFRQSKIHFGFVSLF